MEANSDFVAAIAATDFAPRYYDLCRRHPPRFDIPACKAPANEVLRVARLAGAAVRLAGSSRSFGFELPGDQAASEFIFVIQGRTTVEVGFAFPFQGGEVASTFAILASDVSVMRGEPLLNPPYPRPEFHSLEELATVLDEVYSLGCLLLAVCT
jgi:hypothetical protein